LSALGHTLTIMAENEIIDLGHPRRWRRTRRALSNADCSLEEVVVAARADVEGVCKGLPKALKQGPPLALLLQSAMGSPIQMQAVIAQFTEKGLATLVRDAMALARSRDPAKVAAAAASHLIDSLIGQIEMRAGRESRFRSLKARQDLIVGVSAAFRPYEAPLKEMLESSLRNGPVHRFRRLTAPTPRLSAGQLVNLSVTPRHAEGIAGAR
jgi:hypothetical protein